MIEKYEIAMLFVIIFSFLFLDWHARYIFVATGYPRRYGHGKSFNRAKKHYKSNWTLTQRLLWIPLFKEEYEDKYRIMAYLSYINFSLMLITGVSFLVVSNYFFENIRSWVYVFVVYHVFCILQFIYNNSIGRKK